VYVALGQGGLRVGAPVADGEEAVGQAEEGDGLVAHHKPAGLAHLHLRGLGQADPLSHVTQPPASSWVDRGTFHPRFLSRPRSLFLRGRALPEPSETYAQRARDAGLPAALAGRGDSARSANRTS